MATFSPAARRCRWRLALVLLALLLAVPDRPAEAVQKIRNLCTLGYPSDQAVAWECRRLKPGETPAGLFGERWQDVLRFNRIDQRHFRAGMAIKVPLDLEAVRDFTPLPAHLSEGAEEARLILVDQAEQFLGAYEYGRLVFSAPAAVGEKKHRTPAGEFRIDAFHRRHTSSLYQVEGTKRPYPMFYGLRFHVTPGGVAYWIHGRDIPGYPASHGCIGLYNESMQRSYYGEPRQPVLEAARTLYEWVVPAQLDDGRYRLLPDGPRLLVVGTPPI